MYIWTTKSPSTFRMISYFHHLHLIFNAKADTHFAIARKLKDCNKAVYHRFCDKHVSGHDWIRSCDLAYRSHARITGPVQPVWYRTQHVRRAWSYWQHTLCIVLWECCCFCCCWQLLLLLLLLFLSCSMFVFRDAVSGTFLGRVAE